MGIFEIIVVFVIGYFIGKVHGYYILAKAIREVAEDAGLDIEKELLGKEDADQKLRDAIHMLHVETINDTMYLYEKDTNDFVCQGTTIEELATRAKEYKQILLASVLCGDKVFMFVNGVSKEYIE